jgi:hypothetical protein
MNKDNDVVNKKMRLYLFGNMSITIPNMKITDVRISPKTITSSLSTTIHCIIDRVFCQLKNKKMH